MTRRAAPGSTVPDGARACRATVGPAGVKSGRGLAQQERRVRPLSRGAHDQDGDAAVRVGVKLRRATRPTAAVDIGAPGHPKVAVAWKDGAFTLPEADYGLMQSRVYAAPRADLARQRWTGSRTSRGSGGRCRPSQPSASRGPCRRRMTCCLSREGWTLTVAGQPDRTVRLGAFGTLGLAENTVAAFSRTVAVPEAWKGRRSSWSSTPKAGSGILPQGRLLVNGKEAAIAQPIRPAAAPGFTVDVSRPPPPARWPSGWRSMAQPPAMMNKARTGQTKPNGVTGLFYLQAIAPAAEDRAGPGRLAGRHGLQSLRSRQDGRRGQVRLPGNPFRPAKGVADKRLFIESPQHLGFLG